MNNAALIIVANSRLILASLNWIIHQHRRLQPTLKVIVSYVGTPQGEIDADQIVTVDDTAMCLSRPRNAAAKACQEEWLLFADGDTYYEADLTTFLGKHQALRGDTRRDQLDFTTQPGEKYTVVAAPMIVHRSLFESVGGYHEGYKNYGHEDADFLHKLPACETIDTGAIHVSSIHWAMAGPDWVRSASANHQLFNDRMARTCAERIEEDVANYRR
jgi:hypothetical protein